MIKNKAKMPVRHSIDLTGPDGNAFVLLGVAHRLCADLGKDWPKIQANMMSDDYAHLIEVFDAEFGEWVTLYR